MSLNPADLRQALARAPRMVLESNWVVAAPLDAQHFAVQYANPAGATPALLGSAAAQFPGAIIEWLSGPLGGIAASATTAEVQIDLLATAGVARPDTPPNAAPLGRVITTVAQVISTGSPVHTIIETADPLPALPNTGDRFILYLPPQPTVQVNRGTVAIAGTVDATIVNALIPITGDVTITAGQVDAAITQATIDLPVTGTVEISAGTIDAVITDATLNLPITGAVEVSAGTVDIAQALVDLPITGAVSITAGQVDAAIIGATLNLPVTGNVEVTGGQIQATIAEATIDVPVTGAVAITAGQVDATITQATVDLPITGAVSITAGTIDATITQANIDLPITGSVEIGQVSVILPITGAVEVTAGTVDATITQATVNLPITGAVEVTAGTVDATITNATLDLPVTGAVSITAGTVDANITASSLDLPITGSVRIGEVALNLPITGAVEVTAGTVDATITQATVNLPVTGNVSITGGTIDATITQATVNLPVTGSLEISAGTVDATITRATVNLPITGAVEVTAGTVDAAIVNATIDVPITGAIEISAGSVDVTGNVNATIVNATLTLPVTGAVEVSAGSINATIENATIDIPVTGTTYLTNEQVGIGADFTAQTQLSIPANSTATVSSPYVAIVPAPRLVSASEALIWLNDDHGYSYQVTLDLWLNVGTNAQPNDVPVVQSMTLGTVQAGSPGNSYFIRFQDFTATAPLPFNLVQVSLTPTASEANADTVTVILGFIGTAESVTSSVYNPQYNAPSFLIPNTTGTLATMANGVPLPVQAWDYDTWGGSGYHRPYKPVGGINSTYSIGGNTSFSPGAGQNFGTVYTLFSDTGLSIPRVYQITFNLAGIACSVNETYGQVTLLLKIGLSTGATLTIPMFTANFLNSTDAVPNGVQWVMNLADGSLTGTITSLTIVATDNLASAGQVYVNQVFATVLYNA